MQGKKPSAPKPTVFEPSPGTRRAPERSDEKSTAQERTVQQPSALPRLEKPTAITGTERKRVAVEAGDLRQIAPGVENRIVEQAMRLVAGFVVEKTNERKAIMWGHDLQRSYSEFAAETLALAQTPILRKVEGYLGRMMDILQAVDIMGACGYDSDLFGQYLKGINAKIDRPEELSAAQTELDQLVRYMSAALDELLDLKDKFERHAVRLEQIADEIEASALAALFLSRYLQKDKASVAQRFLERSMSLTQTLAQIRESAAVRDIQIEHPIRMVSAIQNVALVAMPDLLMGIATVVSLAARKTSLSQTEAGELNYKLRDIINRLAT